MKKGLLHSGGHEPLKLAVHAVSGGLAAVCCGYNVLAFLARRERHLAANVALYSVIVALEARKVRHHWRACP